MDRAEKLSAEWNNTGFIVLSKDGALGATVWNHWNHEEPKRKIVAHVNSDGWSITEEWKAEYFLSDFQPIRLSISKYALYEFLTCEEGSFEDHHKEPKLEEEIHQYNVLSKFINKIVLDNEDELELIWYALCSGTFQIHEPQVTRRLADKLKELVKRYCPKIYEKWPYPSFQ